jgi:hypothetical protein
MKIFLFRTQFEVKAHDKEEAYQLLMNDLGHIADGNCAEVALSGTEFIAEREE